MSFSGLNCTAIIFAAVAGFMFGALWYGLLGKKWMAAAFIDPEEMNNSGLSSLQKALPFIFAALANLTMAFILAGLIGHFTVDLRHGLITAGFIWAGFILPTIVVNYGFQMRPAQLTLIDAGHWLGVLMVMGAIIGVMGAPQ